MNNVVYILVREDNQAFLGAYATQEEAWQVANAFRVATEIIPYSIPVQPLVASKCWYNQ